MSDATWNGNTSGGERPRNEGDSYFTPDALALAICRRLGETLTPDLVIEPSAGAGAFVRAARATWPQSQIVAVEPNGFGALLGLADMVGACSWEAWDEPIATAALILGNPPYNLPGDGRGKDSPTTAERHVLLALDRLPEGGTVAFLLRLAFLSGGGRIDRLHMRHPPSALWPITPRPCFTGDGKTDASEYGIFVWTKGRVGLCDLRPLRWSP